ncbi:DUF6571 family protein [Streptomyces sp. RKAG337]|uniref:DUF6571 family protein n=1 Tax=Streptomyces sp. RKAG337 TaxID=2893404 RepID=UPI0020343635|nr:DUF6571 family protein [Streptomyces sp. RKAG337]MCM2425791.1 hypothetical protein [Streptomyces sp. RKAG337]
MPSYHDIMEADLAPLDAAVDRWQALPGKFHGIASAFDNTVTKGLQTANMQGETAEAALQKTVVAKQQIQAAADEAFDVHSILSDALSTFKAAQKTLRDVTEEVRTNAKGVLVINGAGKVGPDPVAGPMPGAGPSLGAAILDYQGRVDGAVESATEADNALHWALLQDPNGADQGFNANAYADINNALKDRAQAAKDAHDAARLASQQGILSVDELKRLDALLAKHASDPTFGTKFYTELGPKKALEFQADLAIRTSLIHDPDRLKAAQDIQKQLGLTLAAATQDVDGDGYLSNQWVEGLKEAGHQPLDMRSRGLYQMMPYGYQPLGALLKNGEYSTEFLGDVSKDMLKLDKELHGVWPSGSQEIHLDLTDQTQNHQGTDPLVGLLEASSRNPEFATQFLHNDGDLKHLLTTGQENPLRSDALGHALEAGVTGHPYGTPLDSTLPPHSVAQTEIMKQVVESVSKDAGVATDQMRDSLARMTSEYMPEINRSLAGGKGPYSIDVFFPTGNSGEPGFTPIDTHRFLYELAADPGAYKILDVAQKTYTGNLFDYHLAHPEKFDGDPEITIRQIANNAGLFQGIMAFSVQDHNIMDEISANQSFNDSLKPQNELMKGIATVGIGVGVAAMTSPIGGIAAGAMATSTGNILIDNIFDGRKMDGYDDILLSSGANLDKVKQSALQSTEFSGHYAGAHTNSAMRPGNIEGLIAEGFRDGWGNSSTNLSGYEGRPGHPKAD